MPDDEAMEDIIEAARKERWRNMSPNEKRVEVITYLRREFGIKGDIIFGCDECGAVDTCEYAFDPYNIHGDCLAEK